ncbi:3-methylcrotonoyl-CoA carboxylase, partial [Dimargaris cristalligena]
TTLVLRDDKVTLFSEDGRVDLTLPKPTYLSGAGASEAAGSVKTPMPCKISQVLVEAGQTVEKNTPLVILEAMKMEHVVRAPFAGKIKEVFYQVGDMVPENKSLVELENTEDAK